MKAKLMVTAGFAMLATATLIQAQGADSNASKANPDGSLTVRSFTLPFSVYASPEARADIC